MDEYELKKKIEEEEKAQQKLLDIQKENEHMLELYKDFWNSPIGIARLNEAKDRGDVNDWEKINKAMVDDYGHDPKIVLKARGKIVQEDD